MFIISLEKSHRRCLERISPVNLPVSDSEAYSSFEGVRISPHYRLDNPEEHRDESKQSLSYSTPRNTI